MNGIFLNKDPRTWPPIGCFPSWAGFIRRGAACLVYFFSWLDDLKFVCARRCRCLCVSSQLQRAAATWTLTFRPIVAQAAVTLQSQGLKSSRRLAWRRARAKFSLEVNCRRSHLLICFKITSQRSSTQTISDPFFPYFLFFKSLSFILELFLLLLQSFCDINSLWNNLLLLSSLSPPSYWVVLRWLDRHNSLNWFILKFRLIVLLLSYKWSDDTEVKGHPVRNI